MSYPEVQQNHVGLERRRKSVTAIVHGNHEFLTGASNFGNFEAFLVTFSHIFTAHGNPEITCFHLNAACFFY